MSKLKVKSKKKRCIIENFKKVLNIIYNFQVNSFYKMDFLYYLSNIMIFLYQFLLFYFFILELYF